MTRPLPAVARLAERASPTDADLVFRARGGDRQAEAQLYARHAAAILGTAARLLGDDVEARDVVQDSFLQAFRALHQLGEPDAFGGWLRAIAVRNVHRRYRRRRLRSWFGLSSEDAESGLRAMAAPNAPPEVLAELALIGPRLAAMPSDQRLAWSLRHIEGESLAEVAQLLGCSLATAKRKIAAVERALEEVTR